VEANQLAALPGEYFPEEALNQVISPTPHFALRLMTTPIRQAGGPGYRGRLLANGFYLSEHTGPPISLGWEEWRACTLMGTNLPEVVWRYFTKFALTLHALRCDLLHLKGTVVGGPSGGLLIVGTGTTSAALTLMYQLPQLSWVSNTHLLVEGREARGVHSNIRIRRGSYSLLPADPDLSPIGTQTQLSPRKLFGTRTSAATRLKGILYRYGADSPDVRITCLENPSTLIPFWDQYVSAIRRYDLEPEFYEDVYRRDAVRFSQLLDRHTAGLRELVAGLPVYCLCGDLFNEKRAQAAAATLERLIGEA
jgi:hypothetical protein